MMEKMKQEIEKVSLFGKLHGTGRIVSRLRVAIPAARQVETLWWGQVLNVYSPVASEL